MKSKALFIYNQNETGYRFNETHPFNQNRLVMTVDLLQKAGALDLSAVVPPETANEWELLAVHTNEYVDAVKALSHPSPSGEWLAKANKYGLDSEDTPFFPYMHEAASFLVGGTILAVDSVMSGKCEHALHLGGGLHHAMPNKAAGFCIYNDAAIAIELAKRKFGARVLYVDTDVHHGDGVQWSFYSDPSVITFSIHETGKFLFPGTGFVTERGDGNAFGTKINLPMEPYTEDESWLECFTEVLVRTVELFKPDLIVSQHGCDAHAFDPLSHVHCSMEIFRVMPKIIHQLAHEHCGGRWVALGGGGYDIWRVVPRAWSLLWFEMNDHPMASQIEQSPDLPLPEAWLSKWKKYSPLELPTTWLDPVNDWIRMPRHKEITEQNRRTKNLTMLYLP